MQNSGNLQQIATDTIKVTRKTERPRRRWRDEVEKYSNITGIKIRQAMDKLMGFEKECIGRQGSKQSAVLDDEEEEDDDDNNNNNNNNNAKLLGRI
jgi:hypothetical protein